MMHGPLNFKDRDKIGFEIYRAPRRPRDFK